jgi:membrane protease subunit HflK
VNEARGYLEDKVPRARGEAQIIVRGAEAYKEQRVLRAQGDADKFNAMLADYQKARSVTRQRLYLETMERVLSPIKNKVIVDKGALEGALPLLPLRSATAPGAAQVAAAAAGARQ